jgi:hypothetical protein
VTSGIWTRFALFAAVLLLLLIVGSIAIGITISEKAHVPVPSFILLTQRSVLFKNAQIARQKNSWYALSLTIAGAMFLGIFSNALFYLALKYLGLPS